MYRDMMTLLSHSGRRYGMTVVTFAALAFLVSSPLIGQSDQPGGPAMWELRLTAGEVVGSPHDVQSESTTMKVLPLPVWQPVDVSAATESQRSAQPQPGSEPKWTPTQHPLLSDTTPSTGSRPSADQAPQQDVIRSTRSQRLPGIRSFRQDEAVAGQAPVSSPPQDATLVVHESPATTAAALFFTQTDAPAPVESAPAPPAGTETAPTPVPWQETPNSMEWSYTEAYTGPGITKPLPAQQPGSPLKFQNPVDPAESATLPPSLQVARNPQPAPAPRDAELIPEFVEHASTNAGVVRIVIGHGRLVTLKQDIAVPGSPEPIVAVGDPSIVDMEVVGPRHLRLSGSRIGVTEISIITPDRNSISMEVTVVADLTYLDAILRQSFPTSRVKMSQLREHVVVEGQARDSRQVAQIIDVIQSYLESVQTPSRVTGQSRATANIPRQGIQSPQGEFTSDPGIIPPAAVAEGAPGLQAGITPDTNRPDLQVTIPPPRIINLLTVPGPQQVMLKVQVAELNRTALRTFGNSFLFQDGQTAIGSVPGSPGLPGNGAGGGGMTDLLLGLLNPVGGQGTLFAVLNDGEINFFVDALRRNEVLKIMAEPTLVAMNGQEASFLAGGEFPVPVPQIAAAGVVSAGFQFKPFGVGLTFIPFIQENDVIRLAVAPEVSQLDFSTPATLLPDTITPVPAFSTRKTRTVVELKEGQTLAISGLLQLEQTGTTARIPGLGDLPVVGPWFSGNSTRTQERELVVLVTPYLVEGMEPDEVDALPGAYVQDPTDCEFYLHGRIEKRVCQPFRATSAWDDPFGHDHRRHLEASHVCGPYGYTP